MARALLIDEDETALRELRARLGEAGWNRCELHSTADWATARASLLEETYDLYFVAERIGSRDGRELVREARVSGCRQPVLLIVRHEAAQPSSRPTEFGVEECIGRESLDAPRLWQSIEKWIPADRLRADPEVVDWKAALDSVQGRHGLLRELIEIFFQEYPDLLSQIDGAIAADDPKSLYMAAHRLKGCLRYFGKSRPAELAFQLESLGRAGNTEGGRSLFGELDSSLQGWSTALRSPPEP